MNDFEQKLSKLLDHPYVDPETGMVAEDSYENAKKKQQVPDSWYVLYVRYVGKLNALPQEELKLHELINPSTNQLFSIQSWPTKQTRAASASSWTAYNKKIQIGDEPEAEPSPCQNPALFIQRTMAQCMKSGQTAGRWDPRTALRKCGKQVDKLKDAVDDYCSVEGGEEYLQSLLDQMGTENIE